ncbi:hypothetical protein SDC9_195674 [bioreactor metagenome]|uniref:Uncharacterized protein n=1 Tax=bioreactor metagenome TaxID=1076179 RepID=A0A645IAC7_9ZZZZ
MGIDGQRIADLDFLALGKCSASGQGGCCCHGRGDEGTANHAHGVGLSEMF